MSSFLLRTPALRVLLFFSIGIVIAYFGGSSNVGFLFFCLSAVSLGILIFRNCRQRDFSFSQQVWFGFFVTFFFVGIGILFTQKQIADNEFQISNEKGVFFMELESEVKESAKSYKIEVKSLGYASDSSHFVPTNGRAILYLRKNAQSAALRFGDRILVSGPLVDKETKLNPGEFDYKAYLNKKGYGASCFVDSTEWRKVGHQDVFSFRQKAQQIQKLLLGVYKKYGLTGDEFAVLAALTLGYKDDINDDLYVSYSKAGAMHILAVSGLHVGVVCYVLSYLLFFLNDHRRKMRIIKSVFMVLLLWCYALITGFSPSVVRATFMFSVVSVGLILGHRAQIFNTVFFSAFILLLINPFYLFDISFQLSYLAVLSIIIFQPKISRFVMFETNENGKLNVVQQIKKWVWDLFCVSVTAQIGTFPLCLYYFQQFSNYFLLTNFVAIPVATLAIYLSVALFITSYFPMIGGFFAMFISGVIKFQNSFVEWVSALPYSTLEIWVSEAETILLYAMVFCFTVFLVRKKSMMLNFSIVLLTIIFTIHTYRIYRMKTTNEILVYEQRGLFTASIIENGNHRLISSNCTMTKEFASTYWKQMCYENPDTICIDKIRLEKFGSKRILFVSSGNYKRITAKKISADILVLGSDVRINFEDLQHLFSVTEVVDLTTYDKRIEKLGEACKKNHIAYYSTKNQGAYHLTKKNNLRL